MLPQVSPNWTVYENGVGVGNGVLVGVGVWGVGVTVAVLVWVNVGVEVGSKATAPVCCNATYTITAPMVKNRAKRPKAAGKPRVTSGIRLPWTARSARRERSLSLRFEPHTRQRVASALTRVPHVGHSFEGVDGVSVLIDSGDYTSLHGKVKG